MGAGEVVCADVCMSAHPHQHEQANRPGNNAGPADKPVLPVGLGGRHLVAQAVIVIVHDVTPGASLQLHLTGHGS